MWHQYAASLQLLARTRCSIAEDCVQEAFIRLAVQDPPPGDPLAWLVRVVRNEAINQFRCDQRRRHREQVVAHQKVPWLEPVDVLDTECPAADEIQELLMQLEIEDREILVAHVWAGLSFRQIAEAYDSSSSVVHRRYQTALLKLRDHLGVQLD